MSYGYHGEIPTFSMRAPTMKATSSSSGSSHRPSALTLPSAASSNASSTDSYVQTTFRDFASHAKRCDRCCDPLTTFLEKKEMCPRGRHLAKLVTSSLFDEANEKYKESHRRSKSRKDDGWQHLEVDIPKGCEVVRNLLVAIDRGLQLPSSAASSPLTHSPSTRGPSSNAGSHSSGHSYDRPVLGENYDYTPAHRGHPHSDEGERKSRHKHRDEEKHRRHRSQSAGGHRRHRSDETAGLKERERRPYAVHSTRVDTSPRLSHDDLSVDSGYSTANGCPSPDIRRGSEFAKDMERRKRRESANIPRSALKKPVDDGSLHPDSYRGHSRTPSSPRLGKGAGVGFNIEGHYYAPGYP